MRHHNLVEVVLLLSGVSLQHAIHVLLLFLVNLLRKLLLHLLLIQSLTCNSLLSLKGTRAFLLDQVVRQCLLFVHGLPKLFIPLQSFLLERILALLELFLHDDHVGLRMLLQFSVYWSRYHCCTIKFGRE